MQKCSILRGICPPGISESGGYGDDTHRHGRGQALVEFAFVFPLFLVVLFGIIYFGWVFFTNMTIINAAREGARAGSMVADPTAITTAINNRVISAAGSAGIVVSASNVASTCLETTSASFSSVTNTPTCTWTLHTGSNTTGAQQGDSVKVTVTYQFNNPIPMQIKLFGNSIVILPNSFNLTSTVQMVLENVTSG